MGSPRGDNKARRGGGGESGDIDFAALHRAALIRCIADGEAPAEVVNRLESDEAARQAIAFERALRDRVAKAMRGTGAPAGLREAVESALRAQSAPAREHDAAPAENSAPRVGPAATREASFWSRRWFVPTLAAAAAVALATLAGVLFVASRPASEITGGLVTYIEHEHEQCATFGEHFRRKMQAHNESQASALLQAALGVAPPPVSLRDAGFAVAGAGKCVVPGRGASSHIVYRSVDDQGKTRLISLFVQVDTGDLKLRPDVCYDVACGPSGRDRLAVWRQNGLIFYVYCPEGSMQFPAKALKALGAPAERVALGA